MTTLVVPANGGSGIANLPPIADGVPAGILSLPAKQYRSLDSVAPGGVLVVGASASGAQLADELVRAGHDVPLAAGEHVRMSRTYRGRDIFWWVDAAGVLDERWDEIDDIVGKVGRIADGVAQFSAPTTRSSRCRCSTTRGDCRTPAGSSRSHRGCTCWAPRCCCGAGRRTSGERGRTPRISPSTSRPTSPGGMWSRFPPPSERATGRPERTRDPGSTRPWHPRTAAAAPR